MGRSRGLNIAPVVINLFAIAAQPKPTISRRSSTTRCRTYPSSVKWADAMAFRLGTIIWSSGRRCSNSGSQSRQNSQTRLDRVSKRMTTLRSICSTKKAPGAAKMDAPGFRLVHCSLRRFDDLLIDYQDDAFVLQGMVFVQGLSGTKFFGTP